MRERERERERVLSLTSLEHFLSSSSRPKDDASEVGRDQSEGPGGHPRNLIHSVTRHVAFQGPNHRRMGDGRPAGRRVRGAWPRLVVLAEASELVEIFLLTECSGGTYGLQRSFRKGPVPEESCHRTEPERLSGSLLEVLPFWVD